MTIKKLLTLFLRGSPLDFLPLVQERVQSNDANFPTTWEKVREPMNTEKIPAQKRVLANCLILN